MYLIQIYMNSKVDYLTTYLYPLPYDIQCIVLEYNRKRRVAFRGLIRRLEDTLKFPIVTSVSKHYYDAFIETKCAYFRWYGRIESPRSLNFLYGKIFYSVCLWYQLLVTTCNSDGSYIEEVITDQRISL